MAETASPENLSKEESALTAFAASANKILENIVVDAYVEGISSGPYHSAHEAYADLLQSMDSIKAHVWAQPSERDLILFERDLAKLGSKVLRAILDVIRLGDLAFNPGEQKE